MVLFGRLNSLLGIFFIPIVQVWGQTVHLTPLETPYFPTNQTAFFPDHLTSSLALNTSELIDFPTFRGIQELQVQLVDGGPTWKFLVEKRTTRMHAFVGLTKNHSARISLYRYQVDTLDIHLITGILHDSNNGFWYEVKPNVDGVALVTVVTDAEMTPFAEPVLPPLTHQSSGEAGATTSVYSSIKATMYQEARRLLGGYLPSLFVEDGYDKPAKEQESYVDIMVAWTYGSECIKSNLPANCTVTPTTRQNMMLAVHFFLHETNTAFSNSGLNLELRLARGQRVQYQESTFAQALKDLKNGNIPTVRRNRKEYKADLVMLLMDRTGDQPETGIAYNNYDHINADFMYSVVAAQFTSIWYLPAHELGHNFGCSHDRGTVDMCHDEEKSSYGYRDPNERFRTIMSYPLPTRQCDRFSSERSFLLQEQQRSTPIIPYFSNNRKEGRYDGNLLGGAANNCAGQIERVQKKIAKLF